MTIEELKEHCETTLNTTCNVAVMEEHELILELINKVEYQDKENKAKRYAALFNTIFQINETNKIIIKDVIISPMTTILEKIEMQGKAILKNNKFDSFEDRKILWQYILIKAPDQTEESKIEYFRLIKHKEKPQRLLHLFENFNMSQEGRILLKGL